MLLFFFAVVLSCYFCCVCLPVPELVLPQTCCCGGVCCLQTQFLGSRLFRVCFCCFLQLFGADLLRCLLFAALLLCFLLCWFGRLLAFFARFVCLFLFPFAVKTMNCHCVFLLRYWDCFCCLFGLLVVLLFCSWCPSVAMRVQQCPPCVLTCLTLRTFCFPLLHTSDTHPSEPCVCTCILSVSAHAVMPVLGFFPVFASLLLALYVRACLCLRLQVCLCLFFVFTYVSMVALYAHACVCMRISSLCACLHYDANTCFFDNLACIPLTTLEKQHNCVVFLFRDL